MPLTEIYVLAIIFVFMPWSLALILLADFFQAQVLISALKGSMSTFLPLVALHIMATTHYMCLSRNPQAANMLRQAEQKTLLCTEEGSFWHALWP